MENANILYKAEALLKLFIYLKLHLLIFFIIFYLFIIYALAMREFGKHQREPSDGQSCDTSPLEVLHRGKEHQ